MNLIQPADDRLYVWTGGFAVGAGRLDALEHIDEFWPRINTHRSWAADHSHRGAEHRGMIGDIRVGLLDIARNCDFVVDLDDRGLPRRIRQEDSREVEVAHPGPVEWPVERRSARDFLYAV